MKFVSIVTPCFNEESNVEELIQRVKAALATRPQVDYEHIFIDNASRDGTVAKLRALAAQDPRVKVIVNVRNFGHIRSPYYGLLQATGDAVILMASDLQDPPELIADLLDRWEAGYKVVLGVKTQSEESWAMFAIRSAYYDLISRISDIEIVKNNTGFGLYDRDVVRIMRELNDPHPYMRGLVAELGFECAKVTFYQPTRKRGITKNNFYTLYDLAMLGITSHSKVPMRIATFSGFVLASLSLLVAIIYLIAKICFWSYFSLGQAPLLFGVFFFASIQLFFTGILGEYIGSIHTQIQNRPLVVEKERINFGPASDDPPSPSSSPESLSASVARAERT